MARDTKRRGAGEGSIFQRADGRWAATITLGYSSTGKRLRKTVYGATKKTVQDKLADLQASKVAGLPDAGKMTVGEWLDHWIERIARPDLRSTTYTGYRGAIDKHLIPRIGSVRLSKLSPVNIQALYSDMEDAGSSARMRQYVHAILRRACNIAMRQRLLSINPCLMIDPPRYERPEMQTLTSEEAGLLLSEAEGNRFHALYVLAITCGLRQGELFGLQWGDIDLKAGRLSVRRTLVEVKGKLSFGPPKSKSSVRSIQLPAVAVQALQDHRAMMLRDGHAGADLVFCDSRGGMLRKSNFYRNEFKPLLEDAGLPSIRFHDLRHTSATMLLEDGVHPKVVQQRLGHSTVTLTLDTYSHVLPSMDEAAAGTFDRLQIPKKATDAG